MNLCFCINTEIYYQNCIYMIHCFQKRKHRLAYEWDETKNKANIRKHGVSFQEAAEALEDPDAIEMYDENHSY